MTVVMPTTLLIAALRLRLVGPFPVFPPRPRPRPRPGPRLFVAPPTAKGLDLVVAVRVELSIRLSLVEVLAVESPSDSGLSHGTARLGIGSDTTGTSGGSSMPK